MNSKKTFLILYGILLLALLLRIFGINWDEGSHLHPDERAIVLSVLSLHFPATLAEFLTPTSSWNPHFFAYGNFPFYLLRFVGDFVGIFDKQYAGYDGIQLVGRFLSTLFDLGTITMLFLLGKNLKNTITGLIAAFLYTVSTLPIQLSHFYAVDTPLTFFTTTILYLLLRFYEKPTGKKALLLGISFGFAIATKISAAVILVTIGLTMCLDFFLIFIRRPHKISHWGPHFPLFFRRLFQGVSLIALSSIVTYLILSPYTFIDSGRFFQQTEEQSRMTKDAFTFPYTFQYALKIPYLHELKNIFLFGIGPIIGTLSLIGSVIFVYQAMTSTTKKDAAKHGILLTFFIIYTIIVGGFAVGFMRYMLPVYPLLCLFGAITIHKLFSEFIPRRSPLFALSSLLFTALLLIWPLSFLHIYEKKHTRIAASEWIHQHIPAGKTIALEHWDDGLPLSGIEKYTVLTYPLYEPDTDEKWSLMQENLTKTDYIILGSNRLYTPLQKLTDCEKLPENRCYVRTTLYYRSLFNGLLGFEKVAEFASYPTVPLLGWKINDQGADESFTVYDHPKIMIFKKQTQEL